MKKWLLIGLVVLLAVGGVIGYLVSKGNGGSPPNVTIPGGPEIKVVFSGPKELKADWEKISVVSYQIQLRGTITNTSGSDVEFSEIAFLFDGTQVAFVGGQKLSPGESMKITKGFPGYNENTKALEVRVVGFQKNGGSTPTTTTTAPPETKPPAAVMTPEEVVLKWLALHKQGKFKEALELYGPDGKKRIESKGGVDYLEKKWNTKPISKITIIRTQHEKGSTPPAANVYISISYVDGGYVSDGQFNFEYLNGIWKITYSEGR